MKGTHWVSSGHFAEEVVGESYCTEAFEALWKWPPEGDRSVHALAVLRPNPKNEHDANAVEVLCEGLRLGFLNRESAIALHAAIGEGGRASRDTTAYIKVSRLILNNGDTAFTAALDLDFDLPPRTGPGSRPRRLSAVMVPHLQMFPMLRDGHLYFFSPDTESAVAAMCTPGMEIDCWSPQESEDVFLFAPGSIGGSGRIGVTSLPLLKKAGFESLNAFVPIVHSASGNSVLICAAVPTT